ncbi:adenylate/guanylate cyclase domain-containing protein [Rhodocytophaga rosea]|uniref:Adenylate/guanylate cyclase domain-containing protein n=1 Tax=Rhodocytophaga rosea TaxID=2704465 RepID=A0A6C0GGV8_9BACT|nr:adenylate/guanylate cyclase domain-containing protein [Rhodocytophaga rosea]QHT66962.1 adenylate/guanylate cyclase domain-containing protein [Rhodocytophaga rosea]
MMIEKEHYVVEVTGEGIIPVSEKETLLEAALLARIPIFHECGGNARCSTCRVLVLEEAHALSPPNEKEKMLSDQMRFPPNVRLACQTRVKGKDVKVSRIIRDKSDISLYVGSNAGESTQQIGEEKELALFFLDIRNFTAFVETRFPFDVIHIIRKLFTTFLEKVEQNHGKIIETSGDGLYAVFGFDQDPETAVDWAVKAGFSILSGLEDLNENYFKIYFNQIIEIGIGINAGIAVGGNIRLGKENRMVVMGHAVNIAARLQNATKELNNNFIISADAFKLLSTPPHHYQTTFISLKGVSSPLQVYLLGEHYL